MSNAMPGNERFVHLVDDDEAVRRGVSFMLRTGGYLARTYASGTEFLKSVDALRPGCVLLDVRMPDMDGIDVLQALRDGGSSLPVVIMTGHGDIDLAVRAMKAGATDFIQKPFEKSILRSALDIGFGELERAGRRGARTRDARAQLANLTPREMDVIKGLAMGYPNKTIAYDLGISSRTVEIHRANMMAKLGVPCLSEALRIAFAAGLGRESEEAA